MKKMKPSLRKKKLVVRRQKPPLRRLKSTAAVNETKKNIRELKEKSELLNSVLENISDGVAVANEKGEFLVFNPAAENITGRVAGNANVDEWSKRTGVFRTDGVTPVPYIEGPLAKAIRGEETNDMELLLRNPIHPEGIIVSASSRPFKDKKGYGVAIFRNITAQKKAEAILRNSENRFRLFVENVKDYAIIFLDPKGYVTTWNEGARRFKGYEAKEIIGKHFSQFYTEEDKADNHPEKFLKIALDYGKAEEEGWRVRKDGTRFFADVILTAIQDEKGVLQGFAKVTRDITERKQAEAQRDYTKQLEASNRYLKEFVFVASHDLQEPLRKIQTYAGFLKDDFRPHLDDKGNGYVERIGSAANRMQTLIHDLLALARLSAKEDTFRLVDLSQIVREILVDLEARVEEKGGKVDLGPLPVLEADPTQMRQLFQNLIGNALKYQKPGVTSVIRVRAEMEGAASSAGIGHCRITVEDNGIGFDNEYKEKIFEVFERINVHDQVPGTGIGLSICKRVVERHGGEISAEGNPGTGSVFTVKLPIKQKAV